MTEQVLFSVLLLSISAIFCALLCGFSIAEPHDRTRRPLILLLGALSGWYLLLIFDQLSLQGLLPARHLRIPVFGLARPALIIFFAKIAHCYLIAARQQQPALLPRLRPRSLYLYCIITIIILRGSLADRFNIPYLPAIISLIGLLPSLLLILRSYRVLDHQSDNREFARQSFWPRYSWPISFFCSLILIAVSFIHTLNSSNSYTIYDLHAVVSALPLIFWLIYYHTPYLFLDLFFKRGAQAVSFALIFGGYYGLLSYPANLFGNQSLFSYLLIAIVISLPMGLMTRFQGALEQFIDEKILGRANFPALLFDLNNSLNRAATAEDAITVTCQIIKQAVGASSVEFLAPEEKKALQQLPAGSIKIPLQLDNREFGELLIGSARSRRRYLSEDLKFISLMAANLAAALSRIELQQQRAAQTIRELELENTAAQLRLKALQAQLDPHFLFNSMNLISSLVRSAPDQARAAVQHLSRVYRYVLDASRREMVSVAEELAFIRAYLEIEQLRFETRLRINYDLSNNLAEVEMPPMLLQPIIENAVKHGISPKIEGGELTIRVKTTDKTVEFTIIDSGVGFDIKKLAEDISANNSTDSTDTINDGNGIGLSNLRQQLRLRYQRALEIESRPNQGTTVRFSLPIRDRAIDQEGSQSWQSVC